jgi:hypothetical protein
MTQPEALRLADELEKDRWHITGVTAQEASEELRRLHDLLGKANALCRIRCDRIEKLEAMMVNAEGNLERIYISQTGVGIGTQVQRQPLDDLIILDLADKHLHDQETYQALAFARAIEREIKDNK